MHRSKIQDELNRLMAERTERENANFVLSDKIHICCHIGCKNDAEYIIKGPGNPSDDYTEMCEDHFAEYYDPEIDRLVKIIRQRPQPSSKETVTLKLETGMHIDIDGINVHYGKVLNMFCPEGWSGIVYFIHTSFQDGQENHESIVEKMVRQFESQSYDHGADWRETRREVLYSDESSQISLISFRLRDVY